MPRFAFTPVETDPFAAAQEYASELGGAPRGPDTMAALGSAFGRDVNRLVSGIGGSFDTVGRALMGQSPTLEIGPDGALSPIDPSLVDAAATLSGLTAEGGFLAPKPEGALGVFAGRNAKTANLAALERAKRLETIPAPEGWKGPFWSPEDIHRETGWFRGPDGEWRFEIPDTGSKYDSSVLKPFQLGDNAIYYEHLQDYAKAHGAENFYQLSWDEQRAAKAYAGKKIGAETTLPEVLQHPALFEAYPELRDMAVARHEELGSAGLYDPFMDRLEITPAGSNLGGGRGSEGHTVLLHEIQHAIQSREGFAQGGSPNDPAMHEAGKNLLNSIEDKIYELARRPVVSEDDLVQLMHLSGIKNKLMQRSPGEIGYQTLAGEVESRNVEFRHGFDAYATPPWQTEDVPRHLQNVRIQKDWLKGKAAENDQRK